MRLASISSLVIAFCSCTGVIGDDNQPQLRSRTSLAAQGTLSIHVINVGQGNATLLVGPDGTTTLVDGGTASAGINSWCDAACASYGDCCDDKLVCK